MLLVTLAAVRPGGATGTGAALSGRYRNLFVEAGQSPAAVDAKLAAAFNQLFHGDPRTEAVYFSAGTNAAGPLAFILDLYNRDVRSEGMSYGMMIAVQLNRRREFDALWNWARTYMYHLAPNHPACGYFSWSVQTNGVPNDEMPAPDGEEYFATALLFATQRWENGSTNSSYAIAAHRLLTDLRHRPIITGTTIKGRQTAGPIFHPEHKMVRFTPDLEHSEHTDASYHLPAFYELWARVGPAADREFWQQAATVSRDYIYRAAHPKTGLTPEYGNFDGSPWAAPWHQGATNFLADAWRTAMNWSLDWSWWRLDPRQKELSNRLQEFFISQGMNSYASRYRRDGTPIGTDHSPGLVAMNAVASLAADHLRAMEFVTALWATPPPTGPYRYYDGMLYLLAWLHCSGEFRNWGFPPTGATPAPSAP